ncbi:MAG: four helix bundle protein [Candidatus Azambacteria bacterium]|nr:four helix bundle protein [Candidatus Azambacteria bacterium]
MAQSNSYKDLKVWQRGLELVIEVYKLTEKFPRSELYGLASQMQRAAVAIPSNIAEGQKRGHIKEFLQFLYIAYGSGAELETQIAISKRLLNTKDLRYNNSESILAEVMKMLNVLISTLKSRV